MRAAADADGQLTAQERRHHTYRGCPGPQRNVQAAHPPLLSWFAGCSVVDLLTVKAGP
jgi:hypothetical protein